ncbi:MAG: hypothetical protein DRI98_15200, partial [Bacteroidetes bacterium]
MKIYVGDLEADGLLDTAIQVWCASFLSLDGKEKVHLTDVEEILNFMDGTDKLIFHNGTGYDFPLLEKLYGYEYKGIKEDTMVLSKLYKPNRFVPPHCPVRNRPHALISWGYRVGLGKVEHEDWSQYSLEMKNRCDTDTEITLRAYHILMEEKAEYDWEHASYITNRAFEILGKQEDYGWKFDSDLAYKGISMLTHWTERIDRILKPILPMISICDEKKVKGVLGWVKKPFKKNGDYTAHMDKWIEDTDCLPNNQFSRVSFRPVDADKRIEVVSFLLDSGWQPKEYNTNDEGEETSPKLSKTDPFDGVQGMAGILLAKRIQIRHRKSLITGLLNLVRADGRIASRVSGIAVTGRAKHAGIVNIPNHEAFFGAWCRKLFICDEDKILIGTDADGCQNRIIGGLVGDDDYTYALLHGTKEDGNTVHLLNQKSLSKAGFEVPYGNCKNLNFAHFFGGGDSKMGKMVLGTKEDGARIRVALLAVAPGLEELLETLKEQWRYTAKSRPNRWGGKEYYGGWLEGLDGRPIFIESEHQILVYIVQGAEAVLMTHAYVFLYDWLIKEMEWG